MSCVSIKALELRLTTQTLPVLLLKNFLTFGLKRFQPRTTKIVAATIK